MSTMKRTILGVVALAAIAVGAFGPAVIKPISSHADRECSERADHYGGYALDWQLTPYPHWSCQAEGGPTFNLGWL